MGPPTDPGPSGSARVLEWSVLTDQQVPAVIYWPAPTDRLVLCLTTVQPCCRFLAMEVGKEFNAL
ncbi:unnamed protein product [Staurois parvus]|uniref:Uncharacterized protein n=1 Tax=Staurois parvus TaxID=386267 RepID=A0ABN9HN10_9NEOB|nr:unnamed protein product [Staurois parvus]